MSAKKDFYLALRALILDNTSVKHCQLYNSQFQEISTENTFLFPCVFIEFTAIEWQTRALGRQEADTTIRLHVGFESLATEELVILDLLDEIHAVLQGFCIADLINPLDRVFEGQDTNHDNVIVWLLDYNTLLFDNAGNRANKLVLTTLTELEIDADTTTEATKPRLGEI